MHTLLRYKITGILLFFFGSWSQLVAQKDFSAYRYESYMDVTYKVGEQGDSIKLDLFLPERSKEVAVPLLIIVHGGGWAFGDKELESLYYMRALKEQLLRNNYAVASINYTLLSDSTHFPTPISDCKDAIKWLYSQADKYQLDTANFGIWGGSAGAHLAMLAVYSDADEFVGDQQLNRYPAHVNYVIDNFGPMDLNDLFKVELGGFPTFMFRVFVPKLYDIRNKLTYAMTGYHFKEDKEKVIEVNKQYSPLAYIDKRDAPTIIFHGTKDRIVSSEQSALLKETLDQHAVPSELIYVEDGDHGFGNIGEEKTDELVAKTLKYIKQHTH